MGAGGQLPASSGACPGHRHGPGFNRCPLPFVTSERVASKAAVYEQRVVALAGGNVVKYRSEGEKPGVAVPFVLFRVSLGVPSRHITEMISGIK